MKTEVYNQIQKAEVKSLSKEVRVILWVSPATRKKLLILKAKKGFTNMDTLINNLLEK